jgi:carbonic anhydrase/acetyltransferase-like protein (isoleucine patch superfamily)
MQSWAYETIKGVFMKYELTDETVEVDNTVLHRVRYLDTEGLGGYIESEKNLSQKGNARVLDNARVFGNACVYGNAIVAGSSCVFDNACIFGNALVYGNAHVYDDAWVYDNAQISDIARIFDDARVFGNTRVSGDAHIAGNAVIRDNSHIFNGLWRTTPLQIQGSRFFFNMAGENLITVGCQIRTAEEWRNTYKEEFEKHDFTEEEQIEYIRYFNLASDMYGFGFRLPLPGETAAAENIQIEEHNMDSDLVGMADCVARYFKVKPENVFFAATGDKGKTEFGIVNSGGYYNPELVFLLSPDYIKVKSTSLSGDAYINLDEGIGTLNHSLAVKRLAELNIRFSSDNIKLWRGEYFRSKKGTPCFRLLPNGKHILVYAVWNESVLHTDGNPANPMKEGIILYARRAATGSNASSGIAHYVIDSTIKNIITEDDI